MLEITQKQARNMQILSLGLGNRVHQANSKSDLLQVIKQMGILQIDTIHIVARSHYLVLWSRVGNYPQNWLDTLLEEKMVFEYWSHAACLIPVEDLPLYRWKMDKWKKNWNNPETWLGKNAAFSRNLLEYINKNGAVKSADFKRSDGVRGTWWDWKAEKIALDQLLFTGELMIARREKFQRVYDLSERVHPEGSNKTDYNIDHVRELLTARTVKSLGIALPNWIPDYYRLPKSGLATIVDKLIGEGILIPVRISGFDSTGYLHKDNQPILEEMLNSKKAATRTTILSPFDPLIWDRTRLKELFSFDFRVECYLPASKRTFGYWLLPILHKDIIIGKMDAKADRKNGVMEIKALYIENGVEISEGLITGLQETLRDFAEWHNTPNINLHYCNHPDLSTRIITSISKLDG